MFRIPLILVVCVALSCAGASAAADGGAPATRPDDRGDRFTPGAASEQAGVSGRPDGRLVPDSVDARNAVIPVAIRADASGTTSFDWLAALIGGLAVGGLALAMGGLLVLRQHGPTPAR